MTTNNFEEDLYSKYLPQEALALNIIPELGGHIKKVDNPFTSSLSDTFYKSCNSYYFSPDYSPEDSSKHSKDQFSSNYNVSAIRNDFPILTQRVNGKPLVWFDNSATTQKPKCVIDTLSKYYHEYNSNVHRGAHTLANLATDAYEAAREKVRMHIGASSTDEIIFVRGATEAINLVAQTYGVQNIKAGDEILLTTMEHHSNIVPWQMLQKEKGAILKVIPINDQGEVILEEYEKMLGPRTRIVGITHVSNVLGTINPIRIMIEMAHKSGACVLIDGAQSAAHIPINVKDLGADFYAFSGHKTYGPTGIGVLYGKRELLESMPPWQKGGGMINNVNFKETTYNVLPYKFEAGTGNIADAVGLGTAIDYMHKIGMENIEKYETGLTAYAMDSIGKIPGMKIIGTSLHKTSVLSFVIDNILPEEAAKKLNQEGIAVRVGHHCAQPVMQRFGVKSTIRASLGIYNTTEEVDKLVETLMSV